MLVCPLHHHKCYLNYPICQLSGFLLSFDRRQLFLDGREPTPIGFSVYYSANFCITGFKWVIVSDSGTTNILKSYRWISCRSFVLEMGFLTSFRLTIQCFSVKHGEWLSNLAHLSVTKFEYSLWQFLVNGFFFRKIQIYYSENKEWDWSFTLAQKVCVTARPGQRCAVSGHWLAIVASETQINRLRETICGCIPQFLGGLSLHLNHLIESRLAN